MAVEHWQIPTDKASQDRYISNLRGIGGLSGRIAFLHQDATLTLERFSSCKEAVIYCDPPYTKVGSRHYSLFLPKQGLLYDQLATFPSGRWLMSDHDGLETRNSARSRGLDILYLRRRHEVLIGPEGSLLRLAGHPLALPEPPALEEKPGRSLSCRQEEIYTGPMFTDEMRSSMAEYFRLQQEETA
jgi:hypothetical protein